MPRHDDALAHDEQSEGGLFRLTEKDVDEFQALIQESTGVWMTRSEASQRANALLALTRIIVDPIRENGNGAGVQTSSPLSDSSAASRVGV